MTDFFYPVLGGETELPIYLLGIGTSDGERRISDGGCPHHRIIYILHGGGVLTLCGEEYELSEGDGFYLPPNAPYIFDSGEDTSELHGLAFAGREAKNMLRLIRLEQEEVFRIRELRAADALFKKMLRLSHSGQQYAGHNCSALLYQFFIELHRALKQQNGCHDSEKLRQLQPVIDHIDSNYRSEITLAELSDIVGLSPQYLCRLFKECLNMRPFEYLARRRIQQAKLLLAENSLSVSEIAAQVGYNDCSYFCSVFKKHEQLSPAEYRSINR